MSAVVAAIVLAWSAMLGTAALSRRLGLRRPACAAAVLGSYVLLCMPTLAWFGLTGTGWLAVAGLTLPCAASVAFVLVLPGGGSHRR